MTLTLLYLDIYDVCIKPLNWAVLAVSLYLVLHVLAHHHVDTVDRE